MFTKVALTSLLATLSMAAPAMKRSTVSTPFQGLTIHSGNINVHQKTVAAADGFIYIGRDSTTTTPAGSETEYGTSTEFSTVTDPSAVTTLQLNTVNPAGPQQIAVLTSGALHYGAPGAIPENAYVGPFEYTPESENGSLGSLTFEGYDFLACPTSTEGVYQIFAAGVQPEEGYSSDCVDIAIDTSNYNGYVAYEYDY